MPSPSSKALQFLSVVVNYIDHLVSGIQKQPLGEQLRRKDADYGHIAAAFSFAYAFAYLIETHQHQCQS